jgi:uncharacterized protein YkwD
MRRRIAQLALLTVLAVAGPAAAVGSPAAQARTGGSGPVSVLVDRINAVRAQHGLAPLQLAPDLARHARAHSVAMKRRGLLFHTADLGALCCWSSISENVARDRSARAAHRGLMRSAPHRANILDPTKRVLGVGVARSGGRLWVTEVFRTPR